MPELPEVEFARQQLRRWLQGKKLVDVIARSGTPLRQTTPAGLRRLRGHTLRKVDRRGKHLALHFDGRLGLYLHLGMTGKLVRRDHGAPAPRFSKVCFGTAKGDVHFCDSRRFGRVRLVSDGELLALPELAHLGPDALDLDTAAALAGRIGTVRRPIKIALLDQAVLAGLGNLHAAEALWRARISPMARADGLTKSQVGALFKAIHATLEFGLRKMREPIGDTEYVEEGGPNPFFVYAREGEPCKRRDGGTIRRVPQGGRSTFYCPVCQRG